MTGNLALLERLQTVTQLAQEQQAELERRTKVLPDGGKYVGDFRAGPGRIPHGRGELWRPGGVLQYDGEWENGLMHGRGTYHFENGAQWEGPFAQNEMHGLGVWHPPKPGFEEKALGDDEDDFVQADLPAEPEPEHQLARREAIQRLRLLAKRKRANAKPVIPASASEDKAQFEDASICVQTGRTGSQAAEQAFYSRDPHECFFWRGERVCAVEELQNARVEVRLAKQFRRGTVVGLRRRRGPGARPQHHIRFDDDPEKAVWIDLSLYRFQVMRPHGKHFLVFDGDGAV